LKTVAWLQAAAKSDQLHSNPPLAGEGEVKNGQSYAFGLAEASFAVFLQSDMNFLRSLPWTPLVSASFEHSNEAAVRGFSAFFSAGAILAAGAGVAGAVVCASAVLIRKMDAKAAAAAREDIVIMGAPRVEEANNFAPSG
jgi:hypothetical protein